MREEKKNAEFSLTIKKIEEYKKTTLQSRLEKTQTHITYSTSEKY